jgi:arylsulfatase A-like enzyme
MLNRRKTIISLAAAAAAAVTTPALSAKRKRRSRATSGKPNVVMICIDDLNDMVSPLGGYPHVFTPNFDRLAALGATFTTAMAVVPACSPSRTAILLGILPNKTGVYSNQENWDDSPLSFNPTLPGYLHDHGYDTFGTGKVFHHVTKRLRWSDWTDYFLPNGYMHSVQDIGENLSQMAKRKFAATGHEPKEYDFGASDHGMQSDCAVAQWARTKMLDRLGGGGQFIAAGLYRPHLPTVVGQQWFDKYPARLAFPPGFFPGAVGLEGNKKDKSDLPPTAQALDYGTETLGEQLRIDHEYRPFLRSYLASVSFADHQMGRLLQAYEKGNFGANTFVLLWSDHGWQLGEKLKFQKFTLWERALRVPFIVVGPGIPAGSRIDEPVSLIDIYPTIADMAGLPKPSHCDGRSLLPRLTGAAGDSPSASTWSMWTNAPKEPFRIYQSARTTNWRLIDYGNDELELYDHNKDPYEWKNIAGRANPDLIQRLRSSFQTDFAPRCSAVHRPVAGLDTD